MCGTFARREIAGCSKALRLRLIGCRGAFCRIVIFGFQMEHCTSIVYYMSSQPSSPSLHIDLCLSVLCFSSLCRFDSLFCVFACNLSYLFIIPPTPQATWPVQLHCRQRRKLHPGTVSTRQGMAMLDGGFPQAEQGNPGMRSLSPAMP